MRIFLLWLTFGFAMAASLPAYAQSAPKRVALVIGNSDYKSPTPKLPNPINDARLMAATLSGLGFDVDVRIDLSRDKMDEAFRAHRDRLLAGGPDAVGLFYYAGHGVQLDDANYLIPVSSTARFRQDVRGEPQLGTAISYMREAGNAVNIVIIDACKDSPYPDRVGIGRTGRPTGGLSNPGRSEGVFIAYAAQPGQTASDGAGANSPFTEALADVMQVPGLDLDDVFQEIASRVVSASGGAQWPYYSSGLIGRDVCFAGCETAPPQPLLASDESTALAQAITANTLAAFTEFRGRFPASANMAFVEAKITELTPAETDFTKVGRVMERSGVGGVPAGSLIGAREVLTLRDNNCRDDPKTGWNDCGVRSAAFSPDGRFVVTGAEDKNAKLWEAGTGRLVRTLEGDERNVSSAVFSPDGRFVVTGSGDTTAKLWEADTGRLVRTLTGHEGGVSSAAFSPDGRFVVTGSRDWTAKLWEAGVCGDGSWRHYR